MNWETGIDIYVLYINKWLMSLLLLLEPRSQIFNFCCYTVPIPWSEVKSLSRVRLCDPMDCSLPGSSVHGIFQAIVLEWIAISFSSRSSQPRDGTQVSRIVDRHFTVWATRAAQEYWRCSLSLLQEIFPTQESNQGLLHCRQILYQLSLIYTIGYTATAPSK